MPVNVPGTIWKASKPFTRMELCSVCKHRWRVLTIGVCGTFHGRSRSNGVHPSFVASTFTSTSAGLRPVSGPSPESNPPAFAGGCFVLLSIHVLQGFFKDRARIGMPLRNPNVFPTPRRGEPEVRPVRRFALTSVRTFSAYFFRVGNEVAHPALAHLQTTVCSFLERQ